MDGTLLDGDSGHRPSKEEVGEGLGDFLLVDMLDGEAWASGGAMAGKRRLHQWCD